MDSYIQSILSGVGEVIRLRDQKKDKISKAQLDDAEAMLKDIDADVQALVDFMEDIKQEV